jgi:inorganic triphosphatase YgiF
MTEIEAKFMITDPGSYWRLQTIDHLADFTLSTHQVTQVYDTYLDTSGRRLLSAGYSLRKREQPEGVLMTLKSLSKAEGAIHRREEWEIVLAAYQPPAKWPDSPLRDRVLQLIGRDHLTPLFKLEQIRILRLLSQGGQPVAELSLDSVSVMAKAKEQLYLDLEVELALPALEEKLRVVAACLQDEWHLQPEPQSKFERALALVA